MGTITDKLNKLAETKSAIKTAIVNKGVAVSDTDTFASYADKIASIEGGGSTPTEGIYGVFVYDTNGNLTKPEEWDTANNDLAVGVAVIDENCSFVIEKTVSYSTLEWGGYGTKIYGLPSEAKTDYAGESNTTKIINQLGSGNAPAADYCRGRSCTVNGTTLYGYLGAYGEWKTAYSNKAAVDSALSKIGGTAMNTSVDHWTSTQLSAENAYLFEWSYGRTSGSNKGEGYYVRAFYHLDYPQINDIISLNKYKFVNRPNQSITTGNFDYLISCTNVSYPRFENIEYNAKETTLQYLYNICIPTNNYMPVGAITINAENCNRISYLFGKDSSNKYYTDDLEVHINTSDKLTDLSHLYCYTGNITISNTSKVTNFGYTFAGMTSPELKEIDTSSGTNFDSILTDTSSHLIKIAGLSLKSLSTNMSNTYFTGWGTMNKLRYVLLKDFGTKSGFTSASFGYWPKWGIEDETVPLSAGARQSLVDTFITYSYDRATAGYSTCTVKLHADTKALLTQDEIAQMTAKGYTLA